MDCRTVVELADAYLSGQLLVETNHELVRHLETCPACREELAARRALRDRLRTAWLQDASLQPRADFAAQLAARLQPVPEPVSRRRVLAQWAALAAGLVVAAGAGTSWYRRSQRDTTTRLATLSRTAAGDHQNCAVRFNLAEHPIPMDEAGRQFGAPFAALASFVLPELAPAATLVDRHSCVFDGQRFAHIVFTQDTTLLSLLVIPESAPDSISTHSVPGARDVVVLPAGPYLGFLVGDADASRLMNVAHALVPPLKTRLA
ncbi:MAG: zf-HC2 domain-containing protein [Vicinamibacterales bacterium]